ncbi:SpvB/TcaC N-terminal domain-containing protein [Marispirochaeta sp.]|uniref:SpvB/TcaC N-terminal domain-containing protein n=1 Tax=Marispirochaeta sp. TaxID=2038653 RepID=UPI0029C9514E|nr:SpvB/TcaC N-terminal domain-containing protein [Marispirochaeta sp.]
MEKPTTIRIEKLNRVKGLSAHMSNVTSGAVGYRFLPEGTSFMRVVKVTLPFDRRILESETALSNLYTWYYDTDESRWRKLERWCVDREQATVTSLTTHFTDMITSTLTLPEGPQAVDFDVNSIKDLKAADPAAEVPRVQGLEAGSMGGAGFSLPVRVPKGRGAVTPKLALTYSSEHQNGWMGRGFDIGVSSVAIDTRFGLPDYGGEDTYTVDGEELVATGEMEDGALKYQRRKEGSFERILWYVNDDRRWEVTDKNGTTRVYGTGDGWIGPDRGDRTKIYRWHLSRVIDANGNTVDYSYICDEINKAVYLREIRYSGNEETGEAGLYRIGFDLDISDDTRPDRRVDARGGFVSKLTGLLQGVEISYDGLVFRRYEFSYEQNIFGQTQLVETAEYDGGEQQFYCYGFEYHSPEQQEDGYAGFEETSVSLGNPDEIPALQKDRSLSLGGSLYTGVTVRGPKIDFWGGLKWVVAANFGLRAGMSSSSGRTEISFLDLTGDSLADIVLSNGKKAVCVPNRGDYFDFENTINFGSLPKEVNENDSTSYDIGLSVGVFPLSGSTTWQWGSSKTKSSFSDLDGDGFVDFVASGRTGYKRNQQGTGFVDGQLRTSGASGEIVEISENERRGLENSYYIQEPLRRWKAYRSGTVRVENEFSCVDNTWAAQRDETAWTRTPDTAHSVSFTHGGSSEDAQAIDEVTINAGESLYFHLDTRGEPRGDDLNWRSRVSYRDVEYFEDWEQYGDFLTPPYEYKHLPDDDLDEIYNGVYITDPNDSEQKIRVYHRISNWKDVAKSDVRVANALIREGFISLPRIPAHLYQRLMTMAGTRISIINVGSDPRAIPSERYRLFYGYTLAPEENMCYRTDSAGEAVARRHLDELCDQIGTAAVRNLLRPKFLDGERMYLEHDGSARSYTRSAPAVSLAAEIVDTDDRTGALGEQSLSGEIVLDRTHDSESGEFLYSHILISDESGFHLVRREGNTDTVLDSAQVNSSASGISVDLPDDGVTRHFALRGGTSLIRRLPESAFEGVLRESLLAGEEFRADDLFPLDGSLWNAVLAEGNLTEEEAAEYAAAFVYDEQNDSCTPQPDIDDDLYLSFLKLLDRLSDNGDSALDMLPEDNAFRIVLFSADEYAAFLSAQEPDTAAAVQGCFTGYSDPEAVRWYALSGHLSPDEAAAMTDALRRYRVMAELLPWYGDDGEYYLLDEAIRSGSDEANQVSAALGAAGFTVWTRLERSIRYSSDGSFSVEDIGTADAQGLEAFCPLPSEGPAGMVPAGRLRIPVYDNEGVCRLRVIDIRQADSGIDYSHENMVDYSFLNGINLGDIEEVPGVSEDDVDTSELENEYSQETFAGGTYGWFYGAWTGNYPWDENELFKPRADENSPDEYTESSTPPPPSFLPLNNNEKDGSRIIRTDGKEEVREVSPEAWIGVDNRYSDSEWREDGSVRYTEYTFAPYIEGQFFHPARVGGDTYYQAPRTGTMAGDGCLTTLRKGKNSGRDNSFSIGGLYNGSRNKSDSWLYKNFQDINGDRYPDVIYFPSNGGRSVRVMYGAVDEDGAFSLGDMVPWSAAFDYLSFNENHSEGFGASPLAAVGAIKNLFRDGKQESSGIAAPDKDATSFGVSINGTASSNTQRMALRDINGDGLPDQLHRDGTGALLAAINTGEGFAPVTTLSGGLDVDFFTSPGDFTGATDSRGLDYSNVGSFGGTVSVGFGSETVSIGASCGLTGNANRSLFRLADVNGDGLPDQVAKRAEDDYFEVLFNLGDAFASESVRIYRDDWTNLDLNEAMRESLNSQISSAINTFTGLSVPTSLPDFNIDLGSLEFEDRLGIELNPFNIDDTLEYSAGLSLNLNSSLTISIPIFAPPLTFDISPGVNGSYVNTAATLKYQDITGDGLPDHVLRVPGENRIRVMENRLGTVGLLKTIQSPFGGTTEISYTRVGNTVDMPQSRWVPETIRVSDGFQDDPDRPGEHSYVQSFAFENGVYDRHERLFCGFGSVRTTRYESCQGSDPAAWSIASVSEDSYAVNPAYDDNIYRRGLLTRRAVYDRHPEDSGALLYSEKLYTYDFVPLADRSRFPQLLQETERLYSPEDQTHTEKRSEYRRYNEYGNVELLTDYGSTGDPDDDMTAEIFYAELDSGRYLHAHPQSIEVRDSDDTLLRRRSGVYDTSRGNLIRLDQYYSESEWSVHLLEWDRYGNLTRMEGPRGQAVEVDYDDAVHTYPVCIRSLNDRVSFSPTYTSSMEWDYRYGKERILTDQNANVQTREYDSFGRLTEVRSPYDTGTLPAVAFDYRSDAFPWQAVTVNKVSHDPVSEDDMLTAVTSDGLGRIIQTAKEGEVHTKGTGWNCSGAVAFDGAGRAVQEGQTVFAEGTGELFTNLPPLAGLKNPTGKSYDPLDRVVSIVLPDDPEDPEDDAVISVSYQIEAANLLEINTDPKGNITETIKDPRGNIRELRKKAPGGELLKRARYEYSPLSELIRSLEYKLETGVSYPVEYAYDLAGRRTLIESPDAGKITFEYDRAGNPVKKVDSKLRAKGQSIRYSYDGHNRLTRIEYPETTDTTFEYGGSSQTDENQAGRLVRRSDSSGTIEYRYGKLGEVLFTNRSLNRLSPAAPSKSAETGFVYDYLGRLESITYPDTELVSYSYNAGGQVNHVEGLSKGSTTVYIEEIGYDEYSQRVYMEYGNEVVTEYSYNPYRRWLDTIVTTNPGGYREYQNIEYSFDPVGNIEGYSNEVYGYSTEQQYSYDALNQLVSAAGTYEHTPFNTQVDYTSRYSQEYDFDSLGNFSSKTSSQGYSPNRTPMGSLNYNLEYRYYEGKPHRVQWVGNTHYSYDNNGNVIEEREGGPSAEASAGISTLVKDGALRSVNRGFALIRNPDESEETVATRSYEWDEENRLTGYADRRVNMAYVYDADNQRTVKYHIQAGEETLYFDQFWQGVNEDSDFRQSKHIYLGETRIATRLNLESRNGSTDSSYELVNTYYYHPDHLGSAQFVTDRDGGQYEHMEYTPYGELWEEQVSDSYDMIPFRFTAKEYDEETGLYYYGARYLDPKRGRWLSSDPAMDGLNWYGYGGNNPLFYSDPDGREILPIFNSQRQNSDTNRNALVGPEPTGRIWPDGKYRMNSIGLEGCLFVAAVNVGNSIRKHNDAMRGSPSWESGSGISVASLSRSERYFSIFGANDDFVDGGLEQDFATGSDHITTLLKDMTGNDYNVDRIRDPEKSKELIKEYAQSDSDNGYIIGFDGRHFFNITGYNEKKQEVSVNDPLGKRSTYSMKEIRGIYLITREEQ